MHNLVVQPPSITSLIPFKKIFWIDTGTSRIDFESSNFLIKFSRTSFSTLHICFTLYSSYGSKLLLISPFSPLKNYFALGFASVFTFLQNCKITMDKRPSSVLQCFSEYWPQVKSSAAVKVCRNKEAWLNKRNLPFGRVLQSFIKVKDNA